MKNRARALRESTAILILSEYGGFFTGIGEFIRQAKRVPRDARVA
jgi:hypothetical protein